MNNTIKRCLGIATLLLVTGPAAALEFTRVQTSESKVTFGYTQMGVPLDGSFSKFAAQLAFDPADLAKAQAKIDIDIASIDTGLDEANEEVTGKPWFNTATYPMASFVSTGIKALGGERYQATGKLSIKGKTLDVTIPVTFKSSGDRGVFAGVFGIKRLDYAIGEGIWSDVGTVANEIQIKFHIVVHAAKK
jgi:polyisoprenoid-binding protein YceI